MKKFMLPLATVLLLCACTSMDSPRVPLYGISLDKETLSIGFGTTYSLKAAVTPKRTTDKPILLWESDDPSIIEVDQEGCLKTRKHGTTDISVTATLGDKSFTATCTVEVTPVVVNIPDEIFRNYCLQIADANEDGILTSDETAVIKAIYISRLGISSLEGIQYFPAIEILSCGLNQLTALDVSRNTALRFLYCYSNPNLFELWLKTGQTILTLNKSGYTETKYKD